MFRIEERLYGLPLTSVERVTQAATITSIAYSSQLLAGVINVQGSLLPVLNTRHCFNHDERNICPEDIFIIVKQHDFSIILIADEIHKIIEQLEIPLIPVSPNQDISVPWLGMLHLDEKIVLIPDLDKLKLELKQDGIYGA